MTATPDTTDQDADTRVVSLRTQHGEGLLGIPSRGVELAHRLVHLIREVEGAEVPVGSLDITMHRDDLRHQPTRAPMRTAIPAGGIDDKVVVLVDDVLYSGRTIRAALDALSDLGRPRAVRLAVLVDLAALSCDADAIVAWSSGLRVQMQAQTHSAGVWRRRGNTGEGWELNFMGSGFVLVQPSELLPPQNAVIGHGLAAQYGLGAHGARGQNQGNVWS